ncbi:hypothetical protein [Hymenobacter sp. HDW8]|uniref:hypothetical protein n=1 Tax=Hymenobacter sp. HDW8 TaxID=2714932 RepID=UPI001407BF12|nr:hypothetical protein [Hymenobacter sp. HDW8]QIL75046.1 hypothetical protein G7064_03635 [Hymenobacter sp. HDW8]
MKHLVALAGSVLLSLVNCTQHQSRPDDEVAYERHQVGPIALHIPKGWKPTNLSTLKSTQGVQDVYGFQNNCPDDAVFCENFVVRFSSAGNDLPLPEMGKALMEEVSQQYEKSSVLRVQDTVVNHIAMEIIDYNFTHQQLPLHATAVFFKSGNLTAQMGFTASDTSRTGYLKKRAMFGKVIASISEK